MQKSTSPPLLREMQEIRKNLMEKNNPTMFQRMLHATTRIRLGQPTLDDYRLVMQWPALAQMFMRGVSQRSQEMSADDCCCNK